MKKNKAQKTFFRFFRFLARTVVLNIPIIFVLGIMLALHRIDWSVAGGIFIGVFIITAVIMFCVFHELEKFIAYLRTLAQGQEIEVPRFHKGIFGSFRLADAFLSVKNLWSNQTLSDAAILENLPDLLLMTNADLKIVFANKTALNFFGNTVLHQSADDFFNDPAFRQAMNRVSQKQSKREWLEWSYHDEQPHTFQLRIESLPAPARNEAVIMLMLHDITQLKLFKEQQADFFANASHELKTPLTIISGSIETLQGPARDDEVARDKFLNLIAEQTQRMTHLVKDLLALSKERMMQKNLQTDVILLPDLLKSVIDSLYVKAQNNHQTIDLKLSHDIPRIKGNKTLLVQVFQNLIDNAVKYGSTHSKITVGVQLCNGFPQKSDKYLSDIRQVVLVSVHNIGNPIMPKNINRLFERFYRIDSLRSKSVEGTGLGLGIAQQIVYDHDGLIDVESSMEKGTTFKVYLPIDL